MLFLELVYLIHLYSEWREYRAVEKSELTSAYRGAFRYMRNYIIVAWIGGISIILLKFDLLCFVFWLAVTIIAFWVVHNETVAAKRENRIVLQRVYGNMRLFFALYIIIYISLLLLR